MKPKAQRIAIAEWCGWVKFWQPDDRCDMEGVGRWLWHLGNQNLKQPPDYLNDLNAMWSAEERLEKLHTTKCFEYVENLKRVINPSGLVGDFRLANATADQRAEALLRTIGKWSDDPEPYTKPITTIVQG